MSNLNITLVQTHLAWENPAINIAHFDSVCQTIDKTDLIILPETFTTGFSMTPEPIALNAKQNIALDWMTATAKTKACAICGSMIVQDGDAYFNRFYFIEPNGQVVFYDKRHLFSMAGEDKAFTSGNKHLIINYKSWQIKPFICYDLRFPVWSRNTDDTDLMIYVANWPESRISAWTTLLKARAIENQCYVAGVNRIGIDGKEINYNGNSMIVEPKGKVIASLGQTNQTTSLTLNKLNLDTYREKFPVGKDADRFTLM